MKVFISIDIEGVTGVTSEEQVTPGTAAYAQACRAMQADLEAVVAGCLEAGATEIVVADGHDRGVNLDPAALPAAVTLLAGSPAPLSMMMGIDSGCAAAMLIGYHARGGTPAAVLDHTYSYDMQSVRAGDHEIGETAINAAVAGAFGVPVVLVSGDDKLAAEAGQDIPGVRSVVVKEGVMRTAARLKAPAPAHEALREGARLALSDPASWPQPLRFGGRPLRVSYRGTAACDAASVCPGTRRIDGYTLEIDGHDYLGAFAAFLTCMRLAHLSQM